MVSTAWPLLKTLSYGWLIEMEQAADDRVLNTMRDPRNQ